MNMAGMKRQQENTVCCGRLNGRGRAAMRFWFTDAVRFTAYRVFFFYYYFTGLLKIPEPIT